MIEEIACRFCGYTVLRDKKFCPHCGMEILDAFKTIEEYEREKRKLTTFIALLENKYMTKGIPYSQYKVKKEEYALRLADIEERITDLKMQEGHEEPKQKQEEPAREFMDAPAGFVDRIPPNVDSSVQTRITGKISEFVFMLDSLYSEYAEYASDGVNKEERAKLHAITSELGKFSHKIEY